MTDGTVIELRERSRTALSPEGLSPEVGRLLWENHGKKIDIEFPSPKTQGKWWLTPGDWVGYIPIDRELGFSLLPKVPLGNVFRMLEYAYQLKMHFPMGMADSATLPEFYERLAAVLAKRVLDRGRKGFYRAYVQRRDRLPFVRGRIDLRHQYRRPWAVRVPCRFEDHTADIEENRILSWTMSRIAHSGSCTDRVLPTVRRGYHALRNITELQHYTGSDCVNRTYNRLNEDYRAMHALCRFFLEHSGPVSKRGDRVMLPFLVNMASLFEMFVYEWLKEHLPAEFQVEAQKRVPFGSGELLTFVMDIVIRDARSGRALCVIDTKYKSPETPGHGDLHQIVTYALAVGAPKAVLMYPTVLSKPLDGPIREIQVDTLSFALEQELELEGEEMMRRLLRRIQCSGLEQTGHSANLS